MNQRRIHSDLEPDEMQEGHRYSIIHQLEGVERFPRVSVLTYLGKDPTGDYQFNARPVAGTTHMHDGMILSIVEVGKDVPHSINKDARTP